MLQKRKREAPVVADSEEARAAQRVQKWFREIREHRMCKEICMLWLEKYGHAFIGNLYVSFVKTSGR